MFRVFVLFALLAVSHAWGQEPAPDVTVSQLDAAVARVNGEMPAEDPLRESLLKSYAETRTALSQLDQHKQQLSSFAVARANAEKEAGALEKTLAKYHNAPEQEYKVSRSASLAELEQKIQVDKSELDARKSQLATTRAAIDAMPGRPAEIRTRMAELSKLSSELQTQLDALGKETVSSNTSEAALWLARAQFANAHAEKAALEEELLSQPMRLDLLKVQLDLNTYEIAELEKRSRARTQRASELRQGEAAQAQAAADLVLADTRGKHELVRQLADKNAVLSKTFTERNEEIEDAGEQDASIKGKAEQLETDLESIEHKLELLGMSTVVGEILRERQAQLPAHNEIAKKIAINSDAIKASSLRQVELEDERRLLRSRSDYIEKLVAGVPPAVVEQISDDLNSLVRNRRDLLRKAVDLENTYAQVLGELDFGLRRYGVAVDAYSDFISERLLWIPSRDKFGLFHGEQADLVKQVRETFAPGRWWTVIKNMPGEMLAQPLTGVMLVVFLLLVFYQIRLKHLLIATGKHVGYVRSDDFANSLLALVIALVLSLKWPLLVLTTAWLFEMQDEESQLATALYAASLRMALYFWGLEFLRIALLPNSLVATHFRWPANRVSQMSKRIITLELMLIPSTFLVGFFLNLYPRTVGGSLGTLAVAFVLFAIAYFFYHHPEFAQGKVQMLFGDRATKESPLWGRLVRKLLFWIPAAAIVAVLLGYTYTAIEIALLLVRTFILLWCVLIFYEMGLRWLSLTRRRMTYNVRHEQAKSASDDGEISIEEELLENDPELLNDEGTKLLNLVTLFLGILGVAWIWAEIFPALRILDSVELWHQTAIVDGREIADPVTLADAFQALLFAVVGWVALRRIPGLLEIFLRQKVKVSPASSYAFTRVFLYASTMLLVIITVGALGVSWSSLQWAVAALSLGIGFGLQEIVANFISGLIILFEQPIRVGDTVTVGDVSGKVTKIQMRATTIRDFDRRELLVPNKEFITTRLLNWSLSDSVTRRLIRIGVEYGTDMDQALAIMRDVAKKHPLVMADPEPIITFEDFGESSLLICLRYYIENLDQLIKVDSELRLQIKHRFDSAGVGIAFPHRDIRLDTSQPLEIRMMDNGVVETDAVQTGVKKSGPAQ